MKRKNVFNTEQSKEVERVNNNYKKPIPNNIRSTSLKKYLINKDLFYSNPDMYSDVSAHNAHFEPFINNNQKLNANDYLIDENSTTKNMTKKEINATIRRSNIAVYEELIADGSDMFDEFVGKYSPEI